MDLRKQKPSDRVTVAQQVNRQGMGPREDKMGKGGMLYNSPEFQNALNQKRQEALSNFTLHHVLSRTQLLAPLDPFSDVLEHITCAFESLSRCSTEVSTRGSGALRRGLLFV